MLQPKRSKYRKQFRGKNRGTAQRGNTVAFGTYGLQAVTRGQFTARQIEATRKVIAQATKRIRKMWIRVFPDIPVTKKAVGVKMGSGKGDIQEYISKVIPGKVLFELDGVTEETAREAFRRAGHKIPMRTKIIIREGVDLSVIKVYEQDESMMVEETPTPETEVIAETETAEKAAEDAKTEGETKEE